MTKVIIVVLYIVFILTKIILIILKFHTFELILPIFFGIFDILQQTNLMRPKLPSTWGLLASMVTDSTNLENSIKSKIK